MYVCMYVCMYTCRYSIKSWVRHLPTFILKISSQVCNFHFASLRIRAHVRACVRMCV